MIMSLGISDCASMTSPVPLHGNLLQCIDHAKRLGYDGVEIHLRNAKMNDFYEIADYANRLDMKVTSIATGMAYGVDGHYMTNPDKEARKAAQQVLIDFIEAGKIMGGAIVMFAYMKGPLPDPKLRDQYKDILFESLLPVVDAAERCGIDFAIEAACRYFCDYLWTAEETLDFVNRFKSDRVTVHLDSFSMNIEEKDMEQAIHICKGKLGHFHFSDSDRCHPGHGHIDFKKIMDALYDIGYAQEGLGGHEYNPVPDGVTAAVKGLEHLKSFLR